MSLRHNSMDVPLSTIIHLLLASLWFCFTHGFSFPKAQFHYDKCMENNPENETVYDFIVGKAFVNQLNSFILCIVKLELVLLEVLWPVDWQNLENIQAILKDTLSKLS